MDDGRGKCTCKRGDGGGSLVACAATSGYGIRHRARRDIGRLNLSSQESSARSHRGSCALLGRIAGS